MSDLAGSAEPAEVTEPIALFSLLRADHAEVERLLDHLAATPCGNPSRGRLWETLSEVLTCHCRAEEDALYRLMSRMPHSLDLAECSIEEHDEIHRLVALLDAQPSADTIEFDTVFQQLEIVIRRHLFDEQEELAPLLASMFDADELGRLAERFWRLKNKYGASYTMTGPAPDPTGNYESWPPDELYELAQIRRIKGRGRMGRNELIQALRRSRRA